MARGLLAEGRTGDVVRMLEPLLEPVPRPVPEAFDAGQLVVRSLLAQLRLLRYGDPARALALLKPFDEARVRERLEPAVRAEVVLWLGWIHTWPFNAVHDDARALHLLEEAGRLFLRETNGTGRRWALLGQARAYFGLGEYPLMLQALRRAAALHEHARHAQADLWSLDLHALGALYQGRYAQGLTYVEALKEQARQHDDAFALGRAYACQAALYDDLGRAPESVCEAAAEAVTLLTRAAVKPGYWLSIAFQAHAGAEIRRGAWAVADRLIDGALEATADQPGAGAPLLLLRARTALARGHHDRAETCLRDLAPLLHPIQHRLPAAGAALAWSTLRERQRRWDQAQAWAERAAAIAHQSEHDSLRLQALLCLARISLAQGREAAARHYLGETQPYSDYFSVLPVAALRYAVLGELALAEETGAEARTYFGQARTAYTLIGDVYRAAQMQVKLAALDCAHQPTLARPLLEAAVGTFEQLDARPDRDEAKALLEACPADADPLPAAGDTDIGATLARASLSVELVAEAWLNAASRLLPDRWMGIYRCDEGRPWSCVREHGEAPGRPPQTTEPCSARLFADDILWLRLRSHPGPAFFFGLALSRQEDPAWEAARTRMQPWMAVAALALDHALLRAQRLDAPPPDPDPAADLDEAAAPLGALVHASPAMREVAAQIDRLRTSHSPVLITGEPGAGKALVARAIHAASRRSQAPFATFPCSGTADALHDDSLFGRAESHEGMLHATDGGTLFLDEVGALPLAMQHRLLHFLQEGTILPTGAHEPVPLDVRIIAATHRDLEALIREDRFLEDLYYRLHLIALHVPPLRERREDIVPLARHFLLALLPAGMPLPTLTRQALEALLHYNWPGNVRQLRNEIERTLSLVRHEPAPLIDAADLSPAVAAASEAPARPELLAGAREAILKPDHDLDQVLAGTEKLLIEHVLAEHEGQVTASAQALGLTRQGLYKKMKRLGIDASKFHQQTANLR